MTWVAWRQHRLEILVVGGLAATFAAALAYYGVRATALYEQLDLIACRGMIIIGDRCVGALFEFRQQLRGESILPLALVFLPALVASYLGAPLVAREYELGTHRLVWTQGVGRLRWLMTKVALLALLLAPAALLLGGLGAFARIAWTLSASPYFTDFEYEWPAFFAYTLFAFTLGVAVGAAVRHILGAMLLSLVAFGAFRFFVAQVLRPNYLPPLVAEGGEPMPPRVWHLGTQYVDLAGTRVDSERAAALTREFFESHFARFSGDVYGYLRAQGVITQHLYQPEERYWLFQGMEAAIFLALALALLGVAALLVRRRIG